MVERPVRREVRVQVSVARERESLTSCSELSCRFVEESLDGECLVGIHEQAGSNPPGQL